MSNDIIVDTDKKPTTTPSNGMSDTEQELVRWVMETLKPWREWRDSNLVDFWDKLMRIYRGQHKSEDKQRDKERSRFIHPATRQAVDSVVAEMEDAILGKRQWFDVRDDVPEKIRQPMTQLRDTMLMDMELAGIPKAVKDSLLLGGLLGTGIAKIFVTKKAEKIPTLTLDLQQGIEAGRSVEEEEKVVVYLEPVYPHSFVIEPSAPSIDDSLGCGHEVLRPLHEIRKLQSKGVYLTHPVSEAQELPVLYAGKSKSDIPLSGNAVITEYWGLVPSKFLKIDKKDEDMVETFLKSGKADDDTMSKMVEARVTIANGTTLLLAEPNPFLFKDRPFISYQHSSVPNQFWGIGVAEAGFNVQVALDREMRTRQDAMDFTAHPMIAVNMQKMPRNQNPQVYAGKVWRVNGSIEESIAPIKFGTINPETFTQSGELERLHQNAVGYQDSATPVGLSPRNATLGGMSMITSGSLKRIKTALQNCERDFLTKLVWKVGIRYMQFDPERYPVADYRFKTISAMAMVAEEQEQNQLIQLLSVVPPESPIAPTLVKAIISKTSLESSAELKGVADAWVQQILAGPSQQEQAISNKARSIGLAKEEATVQNIQAKTAKLIEEAKAVPVNASVQQLNAISNAHATGRKGDIDAIKRANPRRTTGEGES